MLLPPVLNALSKQSIHHRSSAFSDMFLQVSSYLKKQFQTKHPVLILNASGTGAMSAALLNTLSPKDKVLAICAGKFGERWAAIAKTYQLKVHKLNAPWGQSITANQVHTILKKDSKIKAVLIQACETSTGAWHPIEAIAKLTRSKTKVLLIVDAISALGAVDIPMDKWGIDILIGGSQKSFSLPAGMAFIGLSQKAWQFHRDSRLPVYYFDLKREKLAQRKGQTAFSTNVSYIQALHQLFTSKFGNRKKHIQISKKKSQITREFCNNMGLKIFAQQPSPSMTSIYLPKHIDGVKLKNDIEKTYRVILAGGQGKLKGRILRIGHLDTQPISYLNQGLKALALSLKAIDKKLFTDSKIKYTLKHIKK